MLKNYFKTGLRNLLKNKTISIINITGLSVGMAAAIFILLWVQNELSFDNYHTGSKRMYQITFSNKVGTNKWDGSPLLLAEAALQRIPGVQKTTKFLSARTDNPVLNINNEFYKEENAVFVDSNWFSFFNYDYVEGNANAFNRNPNSIILTESLAKKYYGKKEAAGKTILIDSNIYKVQAVIKDNPSNSSFQFNIFFPLQTHLPNAEAIKNESSWDNLAWATFIQINPNTTTRKVSNQLAQLLKTEKNNEETFVSLIPLKNIHFETGFGDLEILRQDKKVVFILAALGLLLLFIACINYVNLSTARASLRTKEVSIKKIIGASSKTLFRQFIAESFLTSSIALIITLLIIRIALPLFNTFTEKHFIFSLTSINIWIVLAGTFVTTIILTSIYPALLLSSFKPLTMLRGFNVLKVKNNTLRKTLVISQFTIALALMISTIVIFKQLNFIQQQNIGYNSSQCIFSAIAS
ncbi:MAG: ABC transporter permease [Segetibacter sp.]